MSQPNPFQPYPRHAEMGTHPPELPPPGFYERTLAHYKSVELGLAVLCLILLGGIIVGVTLSLNWS